MVPEVEGFEQLEQVASGGSATVYRAFQPAFDRWVALKVIDRASTGDDVRAALDEECRLVGRLTDHPNVVTVFESGTTGDGAPFIAMAWFEGGSLADRSRGGRVLPAREVVSVGIRLAAALESAHRVGMLHRDVKPANVVFNRFGEPALTDFGVGSLLDGGSSVMQGYTPAFAAPEVVAGVRDTPASDVYSLGLTLRAALGDPPPADAPSDLADLLERMVAEEADARPSLHDAIAVLAGIEVTHGWGPTVPVLLGPPRPGPAGAAPPDDVPTLLPPTSTVEPPAGRSGRMRFVLAGAVVAAIVAVVSVVAIGTSGGEADRERGADTTVPATTSTALVEHATPTTAHPPAMADRSAQLHSTLGDIGAATGALVGGSPLTTDLPVGTYFAPSASFPALAPLPTSADWYFQNPGSLERPCDPFWSGPVTMDGFAGEVAAASPAIVTVATYSLADEASAEMFFGGRSLALGPDGGECRGAVDGPKTVEHRDFPVDGLAVPVDQVNTWIWDVPGAFGEVRSYGIAARRGAQLYELRVGVREDRTFTPAELLRLADQVIGPA
jgi:serine/threonine protein kinase